VHFQEPADVLPVVANPARASTPASAYGAIREPCCGWRAIGAWCVRGRHLLSGGVVRSQPLIVGYRSPPERSAGVHHARLSVMT